MNEKEIHPPKGERPLECGECKKAIAVSYTDATGKNPSTVYMCAECPILEHKLHRLSAQELADGTLKGTGLCCGNCGTTLESLRTGSALGCSSCYEVFEDFLIDDLIQSKVIPSSIIPKKKFAALHVGRTPGQATLVNPSMRLIALNEALSETLKREDYEQAAWLRDQIKALTEDSHA